MVPERWKHHPLWRWRAFLVLGGLLLLVWILIRGALALLGPRLGAHLDPFTMVLLVISFALPMGILAAWAWARWTLQGATASDGAPGILMGALDLLIRKAYAGLRGDQGGLWMRWAMGAPRRQQALSYLEEAARRDHPEALFELGLFFEEGGFGPGGHEAAEQRYRRAAERGHGEAAFRLAELLYWGSGAGRRSKEARTWYLRSAQRGFPPAMARLAGEAEMAGEGEAARWRARLEACPLDVRPRHSFIARPFVEMGVEAGMEAGVSDRIDLGWGEAMGALEAVKGFHTFAVLTARGAQILALVLAILFLLAGFVFAGLFIIPGIISIAGLALLHFQLRRESRYSRHSARLEQGAAQGDPEACFQMGMAYQRGTRDFPPDPVAARTWLERAASAGHVAAMGELGDLLAWGSAQDRAHARRWLAQAAQAGDSGAAIRLGRISAPATPAPESPAPESPRS